jgi:hypothetical protein
MYEYQKNKLFFAQIADDINTGASISMLTRKRFTE